MGFWKLGWFQKSEIKVTQGQSKDGEPVAKVPCHFGILGRVVPAHNVEKHGEEGNQNDVKSNEVSQISDHANHHGHNVAERFEHF